MSSIITQITEHLRACANCGRGTFLRTSRIDLFCQPCWESLFHNSAFNYASEYPFEVCSLFVWTPLTPQVGNLIYSLKQGGLPNAFYRIAEHFVFSRNAYPSTKLTEGLIVTPPGRTEFDHADCWGEALKRMTGFEKASPFEFATTAASFIDETEARQEVLSFQQKQLSKDQRFKRQFKLKGSFQGTSKPIIFVDDLITTGATAQAAYKALNSPKDFEVWAIARRPKLASHLGI